MQDAAACFRKTSHLAAPVDCPRLAVCAAERAEVGHRALVPKKAVHLSVGQGGAANYLSARVDRGGNAHGTSKRTEIGQCSILPKKRSWKTAGVGGKTDYLTRVIQAKSDRVPSERTKVNLGVTR